MEKYQNKSYNGLSFDALKQFLDAKVKQYNTNEFIESDPIQIPHLFSKKEDIEISAFLTATIAWGNRKSIIQNAKRLMQRMDNAPYDFICSHQSNDLNVFEGFVHRTFNAHDAVQFIKSLKHIYTTYGGMESVFSKYAEKTTLQNAIHHFKNHFFETWRATTIYINYLSKPVRTYVYVITSITVSYTHLTLTTILLV